jgi:hypothetical protein
MLRGLIAVMPPFTLPTEADLRLNFPILLFTLAATTLAGLLFGCAPAWLASRIDPGETLKEGGRSGMGVGRRRLRRVLVVGEFTLALALLAGAGLAIHSFLNLQRVDLGVRTDHVLSFYLPVPDSRSKDPGQIFAYYHKILASIESVPGVSHAAASSGTPLEGRASECRSPLPANRRTVTHRCGQMRILAWRLPITSRLLAFDSSKGAALPTRTTPPA